MEEITNYFSNMVANTDNELLLRLRDELIKRRISLLKFASIIQIPYDRMNKWYKEGYNPKQPDIEKITNWLYGSLEESNNKNNTMGVENYELQQTRRYTLEDMIQRMDQETKFLRDLISQQLLYVGSEVSQVRTIVETHSKEVRADHEAIQSMIRGALEKQSEVAAAVLDQKVEDVKDDVNKVIAGTLQSLRKKGSGGGIRGKG